MIIIIVKLSLIQYFFYVEMFQKRFRSSGCYPFVIVCTRELSYESQNIKATLRG